VEGVVNFVARAEDFPKDWTLKILGEHNRLNAMCAILALRALKVPEEIIKKGVENFSAVPGRLPEDFKSIVLPHSHPQTFCGPALAKLVQKRGVNHSRASQ
jgi:hypothetical protein